jgi:hypothetical protein
MAAFSGDAELYRPSCTDFSYATASNSKQGPSNTEGLNIAWDLFCVLDGRIILKKYGMRMWFKSTCLIIGQNDGYVESWGISLPS